jgi:hypothetical protein
MNKKFYLIFLLILFSIHLVFVQDNNHQKKVIYISDLVIYSDNNTIKAERITTYVKKILSAKYNSNKYQFELLSSIYQWRYNELEIKSDFSAYEVCETFNIDYILYGYIDINKELYKADLKLFSRAMESSIASIYYKSYVKNETDFYNGLSRMVNKQINLAFDSLSTGPQKEESGPGSDKKLSYISFYNSIGYHVPMHDWRDIYTGILSLETGIKISGLGLYQKDDIFQLLIRPGLTCSYSAGINKPGLMTTCFQTLQLKFPAELCIAFDRRYLFYLGTGPQVNLNLYTYQDQNGPYQTVAAPAFSLLVNTGFEYWPGKEQTIGIGNNHEFNLSFYDIFYPDFRTQIYCIVRFKKDNKRRKK